MIGHFTVHFYFSGPYILGLSSDRAISTFIWNLENQESFVEGDRQPIP